MRVLFFRIPNAKGNYLLTKKNYDEPKKRILKVKTLSSAGRRCGVWGEEGTTPLSRGSVLAPSFPAFPKVKKSLPRQAGIYKKTAQRQVEKNFFKENI